MSTIHFVLLVALACNAAVAASTIRVSTSLGDIEGTTLKTRLGTDFHAFRGIRYANPPVNQLRFKNPQPVSPWKPKVFDATIDGPMCPQGYFNSSDYSEDCLRLNVYTKSLDPKASKDVIIYLHPGGFYAISAQSKYFAGAELIMDRDIVFVTINYRLGTLGFLATGTADAPGNAGLKDQVMSFKWVKDHIRNFGGNPNSVTLLGYSAGSFSIGLHLVSPMSTGLFSKAIAMSASPFSQVKYPMEQLDLARKQAELVNCDTSTVEAMVNCLKTTPADEFARTMSAMFVFGWSPVLNWLPVIEKNFGQERFMTADPTKMFQDGNFQRVPLIIGMTKYEFVQIGYDILQNKTQTKQLNEDWETLAPLCFLYERNTPKTREANRVLRREYLNNQPLISSQRPEQSETENSDNGGGPVVQIGTTNSEGSSAPFEPLGELFSDALIGFAVHRFAHLAARFVPVYYYHFTYQGRYSHFTYPGNQSYGAVHHDDLQYLLHIPLLTPLFLKTDPEDTMIEQLTRMWTQFAKTGNPNNRSDVYLKGVNWDPLVLGRENYLEIGNDLVMKRGLNTKRNEIWKRLFPLDWSGTRCNKHSSDQDYPEPL